mmetsp:Transcript_106586/g.311583  ORF Transcript_106586/g.311583 Transcript_106586/m.311583 type:complete len:214 (-) Transcript_106586:345-986(-)
MQRCAGLCTLAAVAALCGGAGAEQLFAEEQWSVSEIKDCVAERLDVFLADFRLGSETCPYDCANCFTDPVSCLEACANKATACGCAQVMPEAVSSISQCCEVVWDIYQSACERGLRGLEETVAEQISRMCEVSEEDLQATLGVDSGPGALLEKTRQTVEESTTAFLAGLQAAAERRPAASVLLGLQERTGEHKEAEGGGPAGRPHSRAADFEA